MLLALGGAVAHKYGLQNSAGRQIPREPLVQTLEVTLESLSSGGIMQCWISSQTKTALGPLEPLREKQYDVEILPGYRDGTKVKFDNSFPGDELYPGEPKVDVTFVLQQQQHKLFRRANEHLYVDIKLTREHLRVEHFEISLPLLSGHSKIIKGSRESCPHGSQQVFAGLGMPIRKGGAATGQSGDLFIRFQWPLNERASKTCSIS